MQRMHLSLIHTLSHFVEVLTTRFPSESQTITHYRLDRLSPRTMQKHQASHFKLRCPQENQSAFMLVN